MPDFLYRFFAWPKKYYQTPDWPQVVDEALERENEQLRRQLAIEDKDQSDLKIARVISIERNIFKSTIIIDKGSTDGLTQGMPVIQAGDVLVGLIDEVFPNSSRVILIDDPSIVLSVRFYQTSIVGEAKGQGGDNLAISLVSHADQVNADDVIVTSGLDQLTDGFVVGRVIKVSPGANSLFQEISAKPAFNLHESPYLFIVI